MDSAERNYKLKTIIGDLTRLREVVALEKTKAAIDDVIKELLAEIT